MRFSLKKYVRTIAANSQTDIDVFGDKVFARSVPSGCQIKFDNGEAVEFYTGIRFGVNSWIFDALGSFFPSVAAKLSPNGFQKISIINNNATAVTVEVVAGFGDIADDSTVLSNRIETVEALQLVSYGSIESKGGGTSLSVNPQFSTVIFSNNGNIPVRISPSSGAYAIGVYIQLLPNEIIVLPSRGVTNNFLFVSQGICPVSYLLYK